MANTTFYTSKKKKFPYLAFVSVSLLVAAVFLIPLSMKEGRGPIASLVYSSDKRAEKQEQFARENIFRKVKKTKLFVVCANRAVWSSLSEADQRRWHQYLQQKQNAKKLDTFVVDQLSNHLDDSVTACHVLSL